jgi:hypothetical protein
MFGAVDLSLMNRGYRQHCGGLQHSFVISAAAHFANALCSLYFLLTVFICRVPAVLS